MDYKVSVNKTARQNGNDQARFIDSLLIVTGFLVWSV